VIVVWVRRRVQGRVIVVWVRRRVWGRVIVVWARRCGGECDVG
jgi:hypothetical protein